MSLRAVSSGSAVLGGASTGTEALRNIGGSQRYQIVGTRTNIPYTNPYSSSQPGNSFRTKHYLPYGAKNLRAVYMGTIATGTIETPIPPRGYYATGAAVVVGGASYAEGDIITPTVATHEKAPTLMVEAVTAGAVTKLTVLDPGLFKAHPADALATTHATGSGNDALTVTLTIAAAAYGMRVGLEQTWDTQTAYAYNNTGGVLPVTKGFNYGGQNKVILVPSYDLVTTDPINHEALAAGTYVGIRQDTNGYGLPRSRIINNAIGEVDSGNSFTNWDANKAHGGTYTGAGSAAHVPLALIGQLDSPMPSFAVLGDSLGYGTVSTTSASTTTDTLDANNHCGWAEKAMANQVAWTNLSVGGILAAEYAGYSSGMELTWKFLGDVVPSHALELLGTNDLGSIDLATFISRKIAIWQRLKRIGVKHIWASTMMPNNTTSPYQLSALPTISSGGTGYGANQTFDVTLAGGTSTVAAVVNVTSNAGGIVTAVNSITNIGVYTVKPSTPNTVTGGSGTGLQLAFVMGKAQDLANQVVGSANTTIQAYNTALKAGTYSAYVDKVIDLMATVESSPGSGKWAVGTTGDALHPYPATHTALAAANTAKFAGLKITA